MFGLSLVLIANLSLGAPIEIPEDRYSRATFEFTNGDHGELACHEGRCSIKLHVFDHDYPFDERTPGLADIFPIVPHDLHISKLDTPSHAFWFGLEFECPPHVFVSHPGVTCSATITIADGKVKSVTRFASKEQIIGLPKEFGE